MECLFHFCSPFLTSQIFELTMKRSEVVEVTHLAKAKSKIKSSLNIEKKRISIEGKQINFTTSNNVIDISDNEKGVYLVSIDGIVIRYVYQD